MKGISKMIKEVFYYILTLLDGFGVWFFGNGTKFSGKFKDDMVHGKGTFYKKDGNLVSGNWEFDKLV